MEKFEKYNVSYSTGVSGGVPYNLFYRQGQPICMKVSFVAGARFDTIPGIAHYLEHMLLAGSKKYPNKRILATTLENLGGTIGATTNLDLINIKVEIAEIKDLTVALNVLNEIINEPLFDDQTMESEGGAILAEIQMRFHNRAIRVNDIFNPLAYQETSYGRVVIGTENSVKNITSADLRDYYSTVFKRNPVSWSISGDIKESDFMEMLPKIYAPSLNIDELFKEQLPVIRNKTISHEIFNDNKADLCFGFRTESPDGADVASLDILINYLANNRSCKLQDELRYKRGLIYGCNGANFFSFDGGDWNITTACLAEKAQEVMDIIVTEVKQLKENKISIDELRLIKDRIIKSGIRMKQTAESWASISSTAAFLKIPEKFIISNYERSIEKVTPDDLMVVANKYFTNENWYLAICGPQDLERMRVVI